MIDKDFQYFKFSDKKFAKKGSIHGEILGYIALNVFALDKLLKAEMITGIIFRRRIRTLKKRMLYSLKGILTVPDTSHAHRVAKNLLNSFDMMWRFVDVPEVEFTSNLAERQLRKCVVFTGKNGCLRGPREATNSWNVLSLFC